MLMKTEGDVLSVWQMIAVMALGKEVLDGEWSGSQAECTTQEQAREGN
jgi:hypothetical protein